MMQTTSSRLVVVALTSIGLLMAGCQHLKDMGPETWWGTGIGALGGGALGALAGGKKGAIIGAIAGAAIGGVVGYKVGEHRKQKAEEQDRKKAEELAKKAREELSKERPDALAEMKENNVKQAVKVKDGATEDTYVFVDPATGEAGEEAYVLSDDEQQRIARAQFDGKLTELDGHKIVLQQ